MRPSQYSEQCWFSTCVHVVISVQGGELFPVVPGERIPSVSTVTAHPQPVEIRLRLQTEAGVFCKRLPARPVLQRHQQLIVVLVGQPVDVLQTKPVFTIDVPKSLLR